MMKALDLKLEQTRGAGGVGAALGRAAPVVLLFGLALVLRLYRLEAQSLWLDEGSTWQTIRQSWGTLLLELFSPVSAYPLYHLLLKGWVGLAGDSEWALRLPSALCGAGAVVAVYFAAGEVAGQESGVRSQESGVSARDDARAGRGSGATDLRADGEPHAVRSYLYPIVAALLVAVAPFALWYAQEAKVYSLLLLVSALTLLTLLRALRLNTRRAWLAFAAVAVTGVFVHRLAALLLVAAAVAWGMQYAECSMQRNRRLCILHSAFCILLGAGIVWAMVRGLGSDRAATGAYIAADPLTALGLTFVRFSVDRGPGDAPWWWLAPWGLLFGWGVLALVGHRPHIALATSSKPLVLLCFLGVPLGLFLVQLAFTRLYEARYLLLLFPAWALVLAYPFFRSQESGVRSQESGVRRHSSLVARYSLLVWALATSALALIQPEKGLFSGDPVKEQYREAVAELARRVQPDDLVVLHPAYLRPLYDYYMRRLTADPAPEPVGFGAFKQGAEQFGRREWDMQRRAAFAGRLRSFLLIAPLHARTVDVPPPGDEYGLVGLFFQYSREQRTWPCGIAGFVGVDLLCQAAPEAYYTGKVPQPATPLRTTFGGNLRLLGYTLKATLPAGPGVYRAGGSLPVTLFWDVEEAPTEDYSFFLHLCRECDGPPAAADDSPPLGGYLPTSTWLPGRPARDDRAIPLPHDLPPGRYNLVLGVYPPGNPAPEARLAAAGDGRFPHSRVLLGTVEIVADAGT